MAFLADKSMINRRMVYNIKSMYKLRIKVPL